MAKCVKMLSGHYKGKIVRVTDNMAREYVGRNRAEYVSKDEWKKDRSDNDEQGTEK